MSVFETNAPYFFGTLHELQNPYYFLWIYLPDIL